LSPELRQRMGEIRIEDSLQLLFDINHYGTRKIGGWTDIYADVYTRLFKTMAQLSIKYDRNTVAYCQGENTKAGSASMSFIYRLLDRLKQDDNIIHPDGFEPQGERLEFTIDKLGKVTGV
ncbi:MAG: hypothetical protein GY940_21815, partial [bacterium]|nr:hypothetical protein [bacterium]